jgi:hypothetical protein
LSTSSSSDSLSSIRTTRAGLASSSRASDNLPEQNSSYASEAHNKSGNTFKHPSLFVNAVASTSNSTENTHQAPPPPPTPAFRIVEDSFVQANSTYPDCSFVPRSSFEGDSVDLANVPIWPPPPGVILISPRQSPNKPFNAQQAQVQQTLTNQRIPMSAQKRYLHDLEEDDDNDMLNDEEEGKYGSIRLIPRLPLLESAMTPGRKIAALPKKMSLIAASPPRFDLEAPPLPSFATVANQAIRQDSTSLQVVDGQEGDSSGTTVTMENDKGKTQPSSDTLESVHENAPYQQPFVFGSPRQQPLTDDSFLKRIDGFAIAKQLEELQRRTGVVPSSSSKSVPSGPDARPQHGFMPRTASSGNLQTRNGVRFEGKHDKEFKT